jgi:putative YhdH/YhfP family quinone oxidoreductase
MMLGTAGLTAALSVYELEKSGVKREDGPVLVTGATGGVGSLAVALLAQAGYQVTAATGKSAEADYLRAIGATDVIERSEVTQGSKRPLMKPLWAGVVDCVGGEMLAAAVKSAKPGGVITCCGLVGSNDLPLNVFPFILRGVRLIGIDSAECPMVQRSEVWNSLATKWKITGLESMVEEVGLDGLEEKISSMLNGELKRRIVVRLAD